MQRTFRVVGWPAAAGAAVLAAGTLAGAPKMVAGAAPAGPQAVSAHLAYACRFPSGQRQVVVTVAGTFPTAVAAGEPIRPSGLRTTIGLPQAAVADLTRLRAATVTGSDLLSVTMTGTGNLVTARWPSQMPKPAPLPASGGLSLTAPAAVQPVSVNTAGTLTFAASGLVLSLIPHKASGAATSPPTIRVACTLNPRQDATLAAVTVTSTSPSPSPSGSPSKRAHTPAASRARFPKGCNSVQAIAPKAPQYACGYLTGYANVRKLNGATLLQPTKPAKPGLVSIAENVKLKQSPKGVRIFNVARLYYKGRQELPPVRTTFLGFGFTPITATLHIIELKPIKIVIRLFRIVLVKIIATTQVSFRISNATVNGVPWKNLGSHCETSKPIVLRLVGRGNTENGGSGFSNLQKGGTLGGMVTVPPFAHCGIGENLDPLFTASISGHRNFDLMTQGELCFSKPHQPDTPCPPPAPKPKRHLDTGCPPGTRPPCKQ